MKHWWDWLMAAGFVAAFAGYWFSEESTWPGWRGLMLLGLVAMAVGAVQQVLARRQRSTRP
jgi:hypothetical protein